MEAVNATIRDSLCKTYRAAGLPKDRALPLVNQVVKWYRNNGIEWTVDRMKSIHHWYITQLSGEPNIPSWVAHKSDRPKGPFGQVFLMSNKQCALAILSSHTLFFMNQVSQKQLDKLLDGLHSKRVTVEFPRADSLKRAIPKLEYSSPTLQALTGVSIPACGKEVIRLSSPNRSEVAKAYAESWLNLPKETAMFLLEAGLSRHAPPDPPLERRVSWSTLGTLSCIQEPSLKARWISNPNRITQHFLRPLGDLWGSWLSKFPTDCTLNQSLGVAWVREQLAKGVTLAGVDLQSATDKLNLEPCLDLVHRRRFGVSITDPASAELWQRTPNGKGYVAAINHFIHVSRGEWAYGWERMHWDVGWPLGTRPSFPLLGLVNNLAARWACAQAQVPGQFRVLGDDIVLNAKAFDRYKGAIESLGGVINLDKTIVSSKAVEFAGHVIMADAQYLKRVKARDLSDQHFMQIVATMGEQAKSLLRPRQRRVWDELKYVPGFLLNGANYSQKSYGEPADLRYLWYTKYVESQEIKTDDRLLSPRQMGENLLKALQECKFKGSSQSDWHNYVIPVDIWESVQLSKTAYLNVKSNGDPRLENGKTTLQVAEQRIDNPAFKPYQTFKVEEPRQEVYTDKDVVNPRRPLATPSSSEVRVRKDRYLSALSPSQLNRLEKAFGPELEGIRVAKWLSAPLCSQYSSASKLSQLENYKLWDSLRKELGLTPSKPKNLRTNRPNDRGYSR